MTNRILGTATTAVCTALAMGLTPASHAELPITLNAGAGYWFFDSDRELEDTATPWVSLEYAFTDRWAAEIFYAQDDTEYNNGIDTDVATWQIDMLYYGGSYIGNTPRIRPYFAVGAGEIDIEARDFDTVETTINAGVGLRWMMTPRFGARLEAKVLHSLDESHNDWLMLAGLNYYFGKVAADVVATGPVDTDGDGVYDDRDQCPGTAAGTRVDSVGCPMPVAQVASIKLKVNFPFDSDRVEERYFSDIAELGAFLQRFDDLQVDVEGHTDSLGDDSYNQQLSQRRAQAVVDLLVNEHGIARERLQPVGYGETRPVASNDTAEGRAENRRVMATLEVEFEEE